MQFPTTCWTDGIVGERSAPRLERARKRYGINRTNGGVKNGITPSVDIDSTALTSSLACSSRITWEGNQCDEEAQTAESLGRTVMSSAKPQLHQRKMFSIPTSSIVQRERLYRNTTPHGNSVLRLPVYLPKHCTEYTVFATNTTSSLFTAFRTREVWKSFQQWVVMETVRLITVKIVCSWLH